MDRLLAEGHELYIVPQCLYEFWVVSTRPMNVNGLGRTPTETVADFRVFKAAFILLDDLPSLYSTWEALVASTPVIGRKAHDARLVAAMMVHGLGKIVTLNPQDFRGYPGIHAVTPDEVAAI